MSLGTAVDVPGAGWLDREKSVAGPRFNRWLVPPAALALHLCIGMAYGFSVFWLPLSRLVPGADAVACARLGLLDELTTTTCNWSVPSVTHVFEIYIAVLGISAAIWGGWLEHAGPRKAGVIAGLCWGGGLVLTGFAVAVHQLWLVYLLSVLCGVGQGLGYITPVSTLIKWFPDRRGMATGFAIMGYGGGAMVGAPLAVWLMGHFADGGVPGVSRTLITMGVIYLMVMCAAAFCFRVAPSGWRPTGYAPAPTINARITSQNVHLAKAWRTPQFWLIWGVLCLNVTAGIAVIAMASPMLQDVFGGRLVGGAPGAALTAGQRTAVAAAAAGLVGLISLFNCLGRLFWASLSDRIGRKAMYGTIFVLGIALYCSLPLWGHLGLPLMFVASVCVILSMYGGGFSTVPAYLADIFGPQMVGAIHGRLITAWSVAGVVGPALIAGLRQVQIARGVPPNLVYDRTLYIMAFLLFCGFICNLFVKPVDRTYWMSDAELAYERGLLREDRVSTSAESAARGGFGTSGALAWTVVGIPFFVGLFIAFQKVAALF